MALGFDLLTALGKNPEVLHGERTRLRGKGVWGSARAWLIGSPITDVFVARAHQLPTNRLLGLADAGRAHVTTWLIWSSPDENAAAAAVETLTDAGYQVDRMPVPRLRQMLPDVLAASDQPPPEPPWPTLPAADFTTFRAACRRHLGREAFTRVDAVYQQARDRTDQWMDGLDTIVRPEAPNLPHPWPTPPRPWSGGCATSNSARLRTRPAR